MKMSILAIALAAAALSTQALAADGEITFNGEITSTTCAISGDGTGATDFGVDLPTVPTTALSAAGQAAGAKQFNITVGTPTNPCTASNVRVNFEPGPNVDPATGMLKNSSGAGNATNVQVAVLNNAGTKIDLRNNGNSQTVPVDANGVAVLDYYGQYEAVGAAVTAGDVITAVQYTVTYN